MPAVRSHTFEPGDRVVVTSGVGTSLPAGSIHAVEDVTSFAVEGLITVHRRNDVTQWFASRFTHLPGPPPEF